MKQAKIFLALFLSTTLIVSLMGAYAVQYYQNYPSYRNQLNYRYNSVITSYPHVSYRPYTSPVASYSYRGLQLMPSYSYNPIQGYRANYDSHIYVQSALDYTYYTHPELFEPQWMDNHQRYVRGLWPERLY